MEQNYRKRRDLHTNVLFSESALTKRGSGMRKKKTGGRTAGNWAAKDVLAGREMKKEK